jgi:hypothetical protein
MWNKSPGSGAPRWTPTAARGGFVVKDQWRQVLAGLSKAARPRSAPTIVRGSEETQMKLSLGPVLFLG